MYQPLSAADEKARLRAQYAAEDGGAPPAPPPLAPRPPPDYIQQTRAEDARSQMGHGSLSRAGSYAPAGYAPPPERSYTPKAYPADMSRVGNTSGGYAPPERSYTPQAYPADMNGSVHRSRTASSGYAPPPERSYTPKAYPADVNGSLSRAGSYAPERTYTPVNHHGANGYDYNGMDGTDAYGAPRVRPPLPPKGPMQ